MTRVIPPNDKAVDDLDPWGVPRGAPGRYETSNDPLFLEGYLSGLAHGIDIGWHMAFDCLITEATPAQRHAYEQGHRHGIEVGRAALIEELLSREDDQPHLHHGGAA